MSINQLIIIVAVAGYLIVNILMTVNFFAGQNIFSKYQVASSRKGKVNA